MSKSQEQLDAINDIRNMMERSSKFLSFSGLAGVLIGLFALLGTSAFCFHFDFSPLEGSYANILINDDGNPNVTVLRFLLIDGLIVFLLSATVEILLAIKKSKEIDAPIWDSTSKRVLINLFIPFITGVVFCLILILKNQILLLAPASLIFYGLALVNVSKYTVDEIRSLGILEIILGLVAAMWIDAGLLNWAIGFGLLHILYGLFIYSKERK